MDMIANDLLKVNVSAMGAELQNIILRENEYEYLWQGDPAHWARRSPVLFPIVGKLKDNQFSYDNKIYSISKHGFMRETEFELVTQKDTLLQYQSIYTDKTLAKYPFKYNLLISYQLRERQIDVEYKVENLDEKEMYFSIGGHPAFNVDHNSYIEFEKNEDRGCYYACNEYMDFNAKDDKSIFTKNRIYLKEGLLSKGALIFRELKSNSMMIKKLKDDRAIIVESSSCPFWGIWAPSYEAQFICIEPWFGVPDEVNSSGILREKLGIMRLGNKESRVLKFSMQFL